MVPGREAEPAKGLGSSSEEPGVLLPEAEPPQSLQQRHMIENDTGRLFRQQNTRHIETGWLVSKKANNTSEKLVLQFLQGEQPAIASLYHLQSKNSFGEAEFRTGNGWGVRSQD